MFVLDTNHKGNIAEAEIAAAAARAGVTVLRLVVDRCRYDLAFEIGRRLWRVQCKWARYSAASGVIRIRIGGSRCTPTGYALSTYAEGEIDLLAAYCDALDASYLLPASLVAGRKELYLRVLPTRNGQRACTNLAQDYDFLGAVAQLGERRAGSAKVRGSSPLSSTSASTDPVPAGSAVAHIIGAHELRERFGYWMERAATGEPVTVTRHGRRYVTIRSAPADTAGDAEPGGVAPGEAAALSATARADRAGARAPAGSERGAMPG
jgi:prevent-host-death family protein